MAKKKTDQKPDAKPTTTIRGPFLRTDVVPPPAVPTYYVNSLNIDLSSLDIRLRVGQIQGISADRALQVAEVAHMYMSHEHFRAVVTAMLESLAKIDAGLVTPKAPADDDKAH